MSVDLPPSAAGHEDLDLVVRHGNALELPRKLTPYGRHVLRGDDVCERLSSEIAERLLPSFVQPGDQPVAVCNHARDIDPRERLLEQCRRCPAAVHQEIVARHELSRQRAARSKSWSTAFLPRYPFTRRKMTARSSSHVESSRDNFQSPSIVLPSVLSFPLNFCEKPGECRHILHTPSVRLTL